MRARRLLLLPVLAALGAVGALGGGGALGCGGRDGPAAALDAGLALGDPCTDSTRCTGGFCIDQSLDPSFAGGYCSALACDPFGESWPRVRTNHTVDDTTATFDADYFGRVARAAAAVVAAWAYYPPGA